MDFKPKTQRDNKKSWTNFKDLCKGCGLCLEKCPVKALSWDPQNLGVYSTPSVKVDIKKCTACGLCELICPDSAIRVEKCSKNSVSK